MAQLAYTVQDRIAVHKTLRARRVLIGEAQGSFTLALASGGSD